MQPIRPTGYKDTTTGYLKLGARYYNPTTGRFTQPDPAALIGGYAYAGDNPINNFDPTGATLLGDVAAGFVAASADLGTVALALNEVPACTVEGVFTLGVSCVANTAGVLGAIGGDLSAINYFTS